MPLDLQCDLRSRALVSWELLSLFVRLLHVRKTLLKFMSTNTSNCLPAGSLWKVILTLSGSAQIHFTGQLLPRTTNSI